MSNKEVVYTYTMFSRIVPCTNNSAEVWNKTVVIYSDGSEETKEELVKVIYFNCITDWC